MKLREIAQHLKKVDGIIGEAEKPEEPEALKAYRQKLAQDAKKDGPSREELEAKKKAEGLTAKEESELLALLSPAERADELARRWYIILKRDAYQAGVKELPAYEKTKGELYWEQMENLYTALIATHTGSKAAAGRVATYPNTPPYDPKKGVLAVGAVGLGKSACFRHVLAKPFAPGWVVSTTELRDDYAQAGPGSLLPYVKKAKVLCLDDIGLEGEAVWMGNRVQLMEEIVMHRDELLLEGENILTHGSTNLTPGAMAKLYDERIVSRLSKACNLIKVEGIDLRPL